MKKLNSRLARIESRRQPKPPGLLQIIEADGTPGPIMPGGDWPGLVTLRIVYDDEGDTPPPGARLT